MFMVKHGIICSLVDAQSFSDLDWSKQTGSNSASTPFELVLLEDAVASSGAMCLDGTPAAYYIRLGSGSGVNKWLIHHVGGGWCMDLDDCLGRSTTELGSSAGYTTSATLDWAAYFSEDVEANPLMYNWNMAYLMYCDGGSFSGLNSSATEHKGVKLHFRGKANLEAVQGDLLDKGLGEATDVVISGCSAGGLAAFLHVDDWASFLEPTGARVVGMPDSGFFIDYQAQASDVHHSDCEGHYREGMRWVFEYMNSSSGVNQQCINANTDEPWKCIFAEHTSPHIVTPTFPLQGAYDSWQTGCDLKSDDADVINQWGRNLTKLVEDKFLATNTKHGIFLDSCFHHCGGWGSYFVDGKSNAVAFQEWYERGSEDLPNKGYYTQAQDYPCEDCCSPPTEGEGIAV